jgi:phospholipid/cholesterol/gamma-HCH transport system substrate-binding protein
LDKISVDTVVEELVSSISAINQFVSSKEFAEAMTDLQAMLKSMQSASSDVGVLAQELREEATVFNNNSATTMARITSLATRMDESFRNVNRVLGKDSPQLQKVNNTLDEISRAAMVISELKDSPERYQLEKALEELQSAARSVRELTESIENNPQSLIWGKKQGNAEP